MGVKVMSEVFNNAGLEEKITNYVSLFDTLNRTGNFAKDSKLLSTIAEFLTLNICHFQLEFIDKEMVDKRGGWGGKMRRLEDGKWATFVTEDKLFFLISVKVFQGGGFLRHHRWFLIKLKFSLKQSFFLLRIS